MKLKVLTLSTYQSTGGAAIAAQRISDALKDKGVDVTLLTRSHIQFGPKALRKQSWTSLYERAVIFVNNRFSMRNLWLMDIANSGEDITTTPQFREADIIHLHWTHQGFLGLRELDRIFRSGKKIVITMHDMWYFTGGCHYAYGCDKFATRCHDCQFLLYPSAHDLSYRTFMRKIPVFRDADIDVVAVSSWLAQLAGHSQILGNKRIHVIPNSISLTDFQLLPKTECRSQLNIAADKHVIIFCAARIDIAIKGFETLKEALRILIGRNPELKSAIHLRLIGNIRNHDCLSNIPVGYHWCGSVTDPQQMSTEYSSADLLVSASRYETFGQTLIEAQACGCLPVSFGNSGQTDIITHLQNGYLVQEQTPQSLSEGIEWGISHYPTIDRQSLRQNVINHYSKEHIAEEYIKVYSKN